MILSLKCLIGSLLKNLLTKGKLISEKTSDFPAKIADYKFCKKIYEKRTHRPVRFAVYKNQRSELALAKQQSYFFKGLSYYWMENEIKTYTEFKDIYMKKKKLIVDKFPNVLVPELLGSSESKGNITMLIAMVGGEPINSLSANQRIQIYEQVFDYLEYIGKFFENSPCKGKFTRRSNSYFVFMFPFLALISLISYPKLFTDLLKALAYFLKNMAFILKDNKLAFVHRDLGDKNILFGGKNIWIVDFQIAAYTNPIFEITNTLIGQWDDKEFRDAFYKSKIMTEIINHPLRFKSYKFFSIYTALFDLAITRNLHYEHLSSYFEHAVNLELNKTIKMP